MSCVRDKPELLRLACMYEKLLRDFGNHVVILRSVNHQQRTRRYSANRSCHSQEPAAMAPSCQCTSNPAEQRIVPRRSELVKETLANIDLRPPQHVSQLG